MVVSQNRGTLVQYRQQNTTTGIVGTPNEAETPKFQKHHTNFLSIRGDGGYQGTGWVAIEVAPNSFM